MTRPTSPSRAEESARRRGVVVAVEVARIAHCHTLQVDPAACAEVIDAAFRVLREICLRDESAAAPRRLAELNAAHKALRRGAAG